MVDLVIREAILLVSQVREVGCKGLGNKVGSVESKLITSNLISHDYWTML